MVRVKEFPRGKNNFMPFSMTSVYWIFNHGYKQLF